MVGLQVYVEVVGQVDGVVKVCYYLVFVGGKDQILIVYQFIDCCCYFWGDGVGDLLQCGGIGSIIQQLVVKIVDCQVMQGGKVLCIMGVEDQVSYFVLFVRDKWVVENVGQWYFGEGYFCCYLFFG